MKPTICVDLDGVLAEYHGWRGIEHIGEPIPGAVEFTRQLAQFARVIIYTTRAKEYLYEKHSPPNAQDDDHRPLAELELILHKWLTQHGFVYDEIYIGQGKPFAIAYVDDRAVVCRPQEFTPELTFNLALASCRLLVEGFNRQSVSPTLQEVLTSGGSS